MKTKIHNQLCKYSSKCFYQYEDSYLLNDLLYAHKENRFDGRLPFVKRNESCVYDKKYAIRFLELDLEENIMTNHFESDNLYEVLCEIKPHKDYLKWIWEEIE